MTRPPGPPDGWEPDRPDPAWPDPPDRPPYGSRPDEPDPFRPDPFEPGEPGEPGAPEPRASEPDPEPDSEPFPAPDRPAGSHRRPGAHARRPAYLQFEAEPAGEPDRGSAGPPPPVAPPDPPSGESEVNWFEPAAPSSPVRRTRPLDFVPDPAVGAAPAPSGPDDRGPDDRVGAVPGVADLGARRDVRQGSGRAPGSRPDAGPHPGAGVEARFHGGRDPRRDGDLDALRSTVDHDLDAWWDGGGHGRSDGDGWGADQDRPGPGTGGRIGPPAGGRTGADPRVGTGLGPDVGADHEDGPAGDGPTEDGPAGDPGHGDARDVGLALVLDPGERPDRDPDRAGRPTGRRAGERGRGYGEVVPFHPREPAPLADEPAAAGERDERDELGVSEADQAEAEAWLRTDPTYDPADEDADERAAGPAAGPAGADRRVARGRLGSAPIPDIGAPDDEADGAGAPGDAAGGVPAAEPDGPRRPGTARSTRSTRSRHPRTSETRRARRESRQARGGGSGPAGPSRPGVRSRLLVVGPVLAAVVGITVVGLISNGAVGTEQPSAAASSTGESRESLPPRQVHGPALEASTPLQLRVPALHVGTRLVQLGLQPDGTVQLPPPDQPTTAGWYRYSPSPGEVGPSVVLGAVRGPTGEQGVFYRLGELHRGQRVEVTRADGRIAVFRVKRVRAYPMNHFPAAEVYGHTDRATLRLITCAVPPETGTTGAADTAASRQPHRNVVVYANLIGSRTTG